VLCEGRFVTGRPPLPLGGHGKIVTVDITREGERSKTWESRTYYRDADGVSRRVRRTGRTKTAAENALQKALSERRHNAGAQLTAESRVREAGRLWFEQREAELEAGDLAHNTLAAYRSVWKQHIEPALGELRLREIANVARCEAWQSALRKSKGPSVTKSARSVLSGVLGYAARLDAIPTNPVRDVSKLSRGAKRRPRAMTRDERNGWLSWMEDHEPHRAQLEAAEHSGDAKAIAAARTQLRLAEKAARWDIPDLTRFMLATGCRVGEALAVTWDDVDLDAGTVAIRWKLVRIKGDGLQRLPGTKRGANGGRLLRLPSWATAMLMRRRTDPASGWPVFPDSLGGWRDPSNTLRVLREARDAAGFSWLTSHVWRKTCATVLDEAGWTAREIADQLEHADPAMTQRVYMGRGIVAGSVPDALEDLL
jgi:integrase